MQVFDEMTSEYNYLEKGEAQVSSKKTRTSDERPKDNNFELDNK